MTDTPVIDLSLRAPRQIIADWGVPRGVVLVAWFRLVRPACVGTMWAFITLYACRYLLPFDQGDLSWPELISCVAIIGTMGAALTTWMSVAHVAHPFTSKFRMQRLLRRKTRVPGSLDDLRVQYYTYAAASVPAIGRFVLEAMLADGRATVMLIDEAGQVTARLACLPASVRETSVVVDGANACVPTRDGRLMALALSGDTIALHGLMAAPFAWGNTGVTGFATGPASLHMVLLSPSVLREADFDTRRAVAPTASDRCGP